MADNRKKDVTRQPREAQSREHSSARKPWAPRPLWMHLIP